MFETLIEGFCTIEMVFDAHGKPVDYRFLEVNPAFEKHTGIVNARGRLMREIAPDLESYWFEIFGKVARTGEPAKFENEAKPLGRLYEVNAYRVGGDGSPLVGILFNDITERKANERKLRSAFERMNLLHQITRAVGEHQDLASIFQVVIRTLEDQMPVDFACLCLYDEALNDVMIASVGLHSADTARSLGLTEQSHLDIGKDCIDKTKRGVLIYEPDTSAVNYVFPRNLHKGGLGAMVAVPMMVDGEFYGVIVVARRAVKSFSSGECEFLTHLSEHVAQAAQHAQLHNALQGAYNDLRETQAGIMQQERLRALGQMASGIAHDINNAISPVSLYTESLLARENTLSAPGRSQLEVIQRAIGDVAQTVARMREFYRPREAEAPLMRVQINDLVHQVVELTHVRWSDMPQQRGVTIVLKLDLATGLPVVMGAEGEIREALTNLVFNAVDAMPDGGSLTLRTSADD
jgi:K+-sensing histidine kinase KdpD